MNKFLPKSTSLTKAEYDKYRSLVERIEFESKYKRPKDQKWVTPEEREEAIMLFQILRNQIPKIKMRK
jgi:hypothetical protein